MQTVKSRKHRSSEAFRQFRQKYAFHVPESHKTFFSKEDMALFIQARYDFFSEYHGDIKIAVTNPEAPFFWLANASVIEILMPDSPFIVDTIVDYCTANDYHVQLIIHPIFNVFRSEDGALEKVDFPNGDGRAESYVYLEINRLSNKDLARLRKVFAANLRELRGVVTDYGKMLPEVERVAFQDPLLQEELVWLEENFVLLGLGEVEQRKVVGKRLGVLRKAGVRCELEKELRGLTLPKKGSCLKYRETEIHSTVNKNRQMYIVIVRDRERTLLLVGHFRHRAEVELRYNIPRIKRMLEAMGAKLKAPPTSYLRKELYKTAQSLPVGFLLTRSQEFLFPWFVTVISNMYATEDRFELTVDEEYGLVWAEVILPLSESGQVPGREMRRFLRAHRIENAHTFTYQVNQIEIVFLSFRSDEQSVPELMQLLKENGGELFSTWSSRFRELVYTRFSDEEHLHHMLKRFLNGLPPDYELHQEPEEALGDLDILETLKPDDGYKVDYHKQLNARDDLIKVYSLQQTNLSELVPILTNFGFIISDQHAFPYTTPETTKFTYVFNVPGEENLSRADYHRISVAMEQVLNRKSTAKPINELVRVAGLTARQLDLVKAFCGYYFKISASFSFTSIQTTLVKWPRFTRSLVGLFETRFDPESSTATMNAARRRVADSFQALDSVLEENICKALLNLVRAIVRTNYFLNKPEISFKIQSGLIQNMPQPAPLYEIYVYANNMEAIHLRGGMVARGGIRWSDRQDDFRTEVLGLMKAQMVKNTVIVPVGSKGGFVLKHQEFSSRQEFLAAGKAVYKRFIACLLELTDNLSATGKVIPAKGIKRLDGDDAYLVVAADKGTATFSDLANEISLERKFWLTDAFASGGSVGYDHKKQGITAKGAWEAVKRHFREIGVNPEQDPITAVGIGDMGGDVFGNGMLLSRSLKLVAAFNHIYIFIDPNPEPVAARRERKRLFAKGGNWDEYDQGLLSKGGGLYERASRRIELSPEAREALGIKAKALSGEELIKAILRAPVDLLWNGGIGAYVKASHETHYQAGDPANDRVRVDASELRAKVVGEGGNLGLTQAARIEAANRGIRLNTDAIDNSGGVNMSDHEVNLKILLDGLCRKKMLTQQARNQIIRKYENDEIAAVLKQNYLNNLGLSLDMQRTPSQFIFYRALIKFLNRQGIINRRLDNIPFEEDLDNLEQGDRALPRPILCALAGFTKLYGYQLFLESDGFNDPWYDRYILRYFPAGLVRKYKTQIIAHPLKREIVITELLNDIVNHAGIAFFQRMTMATGKSPVEIADTYLRLTEFLDLSQLRERIRPAEALPNATIQYEYLIQLEEKVYQITKKLLKQDTPRQVLRGAGAGAFAKMLAEAARYSSYRLPRKMRLLMKMATEADRAGIMEAFRQMDMLEDTFGIFVNNHGSRVKWQATEYFSALQKYRIRELRRITKEIRATSNWEIRFFSKIETAIETLVARLVKLNAAKPDPRISEKKHRVKGLIGEIAVRHTRGELSAATLYEMLEHLNERVIG